MHEGDVDDINLEFLDNLEFNEKESFERNEVLTVGIVPSNYYYMLETLTFYMDISFYISLDMCHEMIVLSLSIIVGNSCMYEIHVSEIQITIL